MTEPAPAVVPTPDSAAPVGRQRRVWDLVLTIILLVAYLILTLVVSISAFFLAFAGDSCGASSVCNYDQMGTGMTVAYLGVWVPVLFVIIAAIVLLVVKRIAFWVPLVGGLLTIIIAVAGWALTITAIQPG